MEENKTCFSIIPNQKNWEAQGELPLKNTGKLQEGQSVHVRLDNYPAEQFGYLYGEVSHISVNATNDAYRVTIRLPQQLRTNHQKVLAFRQKLSGTADIITKDVSLWSRIWMPIRKMWD